MFGCTTDDGTLSSPPATSHDDHTTTKSILQENKELRKKVKRMTSHIGRMEETWLGERQQYEQQLNEMRKRLDGAVYTSISNHQGMYLLSVV
jgi:conjugal transfer/entry exclusion protein